MLYVRDANTTCITQCGEQNRISCDRCINRWTAAMIDPKANETRESGAHIPPLLTRNRNWRQNFFFPLRQQKAQCEKAQYSMYSLSTGESRGDKRESDDPVVSLSDSWHKCIFVSRILWQLTPGGATANTITHSKLPVKEVMAMQCLFPFRANSHSHARTDD